MTTQNTRPDLGHVNNRLKCMDCSYEFNYSQLVTIKKRQRCPECGSIHYDIIPELIAAGYCKMKGGSYHG